MTKLQIISVTNKKYPEIYQAFADRSAPKTISAFGNIDLLQNKIISFFCSSQCPGNLIISAADLAKQWSQTNRTVISGFHSPVERECLNVLLKGKSPIIICPARNIQNMRLPAAWKTAIEDKRLLVISPFNDNIRRPTADIAVERNKFIAALADEIFIAYAAPNSKMIKFAKDLILLNKPVHTFEKNKHLLQLDAKPLSELGSNSVQ